MPDIFIISPLEFIPFLFTEIYIKRYTAVFITYVQAGDFILISGKLVSHWSLPLFLFLDYSLADKKRVCNWQNIKKISTFFVEEIEFLKFLKVSIYKPIICMIKLYYGFEKMSPDFNIEVRAFLHPLTI